MQDFGSNFCMMIKFPTLKLTYWMQQWRELRMDRYVCNFAKEAKEGFARIAKLFEMVGEIEKTHEERYRKLLANIEMEKFSQQTKETAWECMECGHIHYGVKAHWKMSCLYGKSRKIYEKT